MAKLKDILGTDLYKQLPEEVKSKYEGKDLVDSKDYIPKSRFDEVNEEKKDYKSQLKERDKQLKELKEGYKDNEELSAKIKELEEANSTMKETYETKYKEMKKNNAIEKALEGSKAKNTKLVKALLDESKLKITDDGEVIGLDEQLKAIQKENDYLFETKVDTGSFNTGGKGGTEPKQKSLGERLAEERKAQASVNIDQFIK